MRKLLKRFLGWVFKEEIEETLDCMLENQKMIDELQKQVIDTVKLQQALENMQYIRDNCDVAVDIDEDPQTRNKKSWAVISLQGKKHSYIRFIDFADSQIIEIAKFLDTYRNVNVDAFPKQQEYIMY